MTIAGYYSYCNYMVVDGYFYDNSFRRCWPDPYKGRDCSTFTEFALVDGGGYAGVQECGTSFTLAEACFNTSRPSWFIERFGANLPGTFITREQAQTTPSWAFHGNNFGQEEGDDDDGHVESVVGDGTNKTVGAHSRTEGVGYLEDGLADPFLEWFAARRGG